MIKDKKIIYIIIHIHKTGGTSIKKHIKKNFKKNQVLFIYGGINPLLTTRSGVVDYIKTFSDKKKNAIQVIIGHQAFYGLHELFPGRECRYMTFMRSPETLIVSWYNYTKMYVEAGMSRVIGDGVDSILIERNNMISFDQSLEINKKHHDPAFSLLVENLLSSLDEDIFSDKNMERIRQVLDRFYFVGLTEKSDDFLFLYGKLNIRKFFLRFNESRKYVAYSDLSDSQKDRIVKNNPFDDLLYKYSKITNQRLKLQLTDFNMAIEDAKIKKSRSYWLYGPEILFYRLVDILRQRSIFFFKFIDFIQFRYK